MNERSEALIAQYGSSVFNDSAMRKYLPGDTYKQLKKIIDQGKPMSELTKEFGLAYDTIRRIIYGNKEIP